MFKKFFAILTASSCALFAADDFYKYTNYNPLDPANGIAFAEFAAPAGKARPQTWWHWINGNVSREGIDKDLKAMSENGYGAAIIFNIDGADEGSLKFASKEWFDNFKYTVDTAAKYGMEIGIHNCDGWSEAGGPWVKVEDSMKMLTFTRTRVAGSGKEIAIKLEAPYKRRDFYRDIAVVAWQSKKPVDVSMKKSLEKISPANANTAFGGRKGREALADSDFNEVFVIAGKDGGKSSYGFVLEFKEPFKASSAHINVAVEWDAVSPLFIEASDDNKTFEQVAWLDINSTSGSVNFPARAAKYWRVMRYTKAERKQNGNLSRDAVIKEFELVPDGEQPRNASLIDGMRVKAGLDDFVRSSFNPNQSAIPQSAAVDFNSVKVFKGAVKPDGTFVWNVPQGEWEIMRLGYTTKDRGVHPATSGGKGLEIDKLSREALDRHFAAYDAKMIDVSADKRGKTFKYIETDSWECGAQNWTENLDAIFTDVNGYDMLKFAPIFAGEIVGDLQTSEGFLSDFRRVLSKLVCENFYGHFGELVRGRGLLYETEPCGGYFMGDEWSIYRVADIPQNEMWQEERKIGSFQAARGGTLSGGVASVAHFYGKEITTCESLTAKKGNWADTPLVLKGMSDSILLAGYNTMVFHSYVHQFDERFPGWAMNPWGTTLNRKMPWWSMAKPFFSYIARVQYMLQKGRSAANILIVSGDEIPNTTGHFELPKNIEVDVINADAVRNFLKVEGGKFVSAGNMKYEFLALSKNRYFSADTLEKLKKYVSEGGKICGYKLEKYDTLKGGDMAKKRWDALNKELFGDGKKRIINIGKGSVYAGYSAKEASGQLGLTESFTYSEKIPAGEIPWRKRISPNGDIYYWLVNSCGEKREITASFNVQGMGVQIWNPEDGTRIGADVAREIGGRTELPIVFNPYSSLFVVFKGAAQRRVESLSVNGVKVFPTDNSATAADLAKSAGNFTISFTANPRAERTLTQAAQSGIMNTAGENFAFYPEGVHHKLGGNHCGVGVSVGSNSIGVYEHSESYLSCALFADVKVAPDSRVAVVYKDNVPSIYLDGKLLKRGEKSRRTAHMPAVKSLRFSGELKDVRLEEKPFSEAEIVADKKYVAPKKSEVLNPVLRIKGGELYAQFFEDGKLEATLSDGSKQTLAATDLPKPFEIAPPFKVEFNPTLGAPKSAQFDKLESWTENKNDGIKNYSGVAVYKKSFDFPAGILKKGVKAYLDAEKIAEVAEVYLNGKYAGTIWKMPYRIDITNQLQSGENTLEIRVANTWVNRCLYDASLPADKRITWSNTMDIHYTPTDRAPDSRAWNQGAIESGIIGNLKIVFSKEIH